MDRRPPIEHFPPDPRRKGVKDRGRPEVKDLQAFSDAELVELTQEGDVTAFNQLVGRWESSLYGFVRRTLGNGEDARDVCQEALVKAYTNITRLRDGGKFKSWIHYIALNLCRDRFRSPRARAESVSYEEGGSTDLVDAGVAPSDRQAENAVLSDVLVSALSELPQEQRQSILLREYQGFTSEEIGEIMNVPAATVRTRIYYGLRTMRKSLDQRGIGPQDL